MLNNNAMKITFFGHACLGIEVGGKKLIVDPFISGNPKAESIDVDTIQVDYVLITHAHLDHVLDVERIMRNNPEAVIVSNAEISAYYGAKGFANHPMNHGGNWAFDFGKLTYTYALHSSSFDDGTYGGNPGGFILNGQGKTIYIAGDTALTLEMKLIPMRHQLDLAVLPLGDNFTMGVQDAVIAAEFLETDKILGYHYDTFGYILLDHESAIKSFFEKGKDLMLLEIGSSIEL